MEPREGAPAVQAVTFDHACVGCGYNLRGLVRDGVCPECGKPVADSLHGNLLRFASPGYLASLHSGVFLVLASIIAQILCIVLMVIATILGLVFARPQPGASSSAFISTFIIVTNGLAALLTFVTLYGWWKLSEPDPGYEGRDDASQARRWLRALVIVQAIGTVMGYVLSLFFPMAISGLLAALGIGSGAGATSGTAVGAGILLGVVAILLAIVINLAWIASFFLQMVYVRWLAVRVPDGWIDRRAKLLLWLGPLLYVVGSFCVGIGSLVALILYWNMLDRLREGLKGIRIAQGSLKA